MLRICQWSLSRLTIKSRRKFFVLAFLQSLLPILDFIGILSIGVAVGILSNTITLENRGILPAEVFSLFDGSVDSQEFMIVCVFGFLTVLFVLKGILSIQLTRMSFKILSDSNVEISKRTAHNFFSSDIVSIQKRTTLDSADALNSGENFATIGVLGSLINLVGELALVIPVALYLTVYQPVVALISLLYFGLLFLATQRYFSRISNQLGKDRTRVYKELEKQIQDNIILFREFLVANKLSSRLDIYSQLRRKSSHTTWKIYWIGLIPKYMLEAAFMLGIFLVALVQMLVFQQQNNATTLVTFIFAGTRLMPSLLRIQSAINTINMSYGATHYLQDMLSDLGTKDPGAIGMREFYTQGEAIFEPNISFSGVKFRYPNSTMDGIDIDSLFIRGGERVGLVGQSGAGKSTVADLLLGALSPTSGQILLSNLQPQECLRVYPGLIGYVPQVPSMLEVSVAENVALGLAANDIDMARVFEVLELVGLGETIQALPNGMLENVGERGARLSGGEKQRLSLARALYSKPKIIVLDEATSSLDAESENLINLAMSGLHSETTLIVIAHRLTTVRKFDRLLYLRDGKIIADGKFEEIRSKVPDFDHQAKLMGL